MLIEKKINKKILISLSECGALILYSDGKEIVTGFNSKTHSKTDAIKLYNILEEDADAEIYVFVDYAAISVKKAEFYWANLFRRNNGIQKLILSSPKKYFLVASKVIYKKFKLGFKGAAASNVFEVINYNCPEQKSLDDWIEMLLNFRNVVAGIYCFPTALASVLKYINSKKYYNIIVSENPCGWVRISGYYKDVLINTEVMVNIKNVDYNDKIFNAALKRFVIGFKGSEKIKAKDLKIIFFTSNDVSKIVEKWKIKVDTAFYTTKNIFEKIGWNRNQIGYEKKFDYLILANSIITKMPQLRFFNYKIQSQANFYNKVRNIKNALVLLNIIGLASVTYSFNSMLSSLKKYSININYYENLLKDISHLKKQLKYLEYENNFSLNVAQINEIVESHLLLSSYLTSANSSISALNNLNLPTQYAKQLNWYYENSSVINGYDGNEHIIGGLYNKNYEISVAYWLEVPSNLEINFAENIKATNMLRYNVQKFKKLYEDFSLYKIKLTKTNEISEP